MVLFPWFVLADTWRLLLIVIKKPTEHRSHATVRACVVLVVVASDCSTQTHEQCT